MGFKKRPLSEAAVQFMEARVEEVALTAQLARSTARSQRAYPLDAVTDYVRRDLASWSDPLSLEIDRLRRSVEGAARSLRQLRTSHAAQGAREKDATLHAVLELLGCDPPDPTFAPCVDAAVHHVRRAIAQLEAAAAELGAVGGRLEPAASKQSPTDRKMDRAVLLLRGFGLSWAEVGRAMMSLFPGCYSDEKRAADTTRRRHTNVCNRRGVGDRRHAHEFLKLLARLPQTDHDSSE